MTYTNAQYFTYCMFLFFFFSVGSPAAWVIAGTETDKTAFWAATSLHVPYFVLVSKEETYKALNAKRAAGYEGKSGCCAHEFCAENRLLNILLFDIFNVTNYLTCVYVIFAFYCFSGCTHTSLVGYRQQHAGDV